ncbi:hypothetical protein GYMLUDRAFT_55792 [Collybiopsis luxurians FD-317 M1]|nr:hypothetical protein GYMLUDRAFT_55792 [Collybiopsis luxurians FD-317 M1]
MDSGNFTLGTKLRTDNYLYLLAFSQSVQQSDLDLVHLPLHHSDWNISALLYYDHLLTFDAEVQFIWSRLSNSSSKLFLLNRGLPLSSTSKNVHLANFYMADLPYRGCHPWAEFQQFFHAFVQVIVTIVLYGRDKRVIAGLVFSIVSGICVTIVSLTFSHSTITVSLYPIGCHDVLDLKKIDATYLTRSSAFHHSTWTDPTISGFHGLGTHSDIRCSSIQHDSHQSLPRALSTKSKVISVYDYCPGWSVWPTFHLISHNDLTVKMLPGLHRLYVF